MVFIKSGLHILLLIFPFVLTSNEYENFALELNDETFNNAVQDGSYFVMFYAPWCGHCKRLHPLWNQLAEIKNKEPNNDVVIAKVDCTESKITCSEQEVTGYPTLRLFRQKHADSVKYQGTRDLPAFVEFLNEQLSKKVEEGGENIIKSSQRKVFELTEETFAKQVSDGKHFVKFFAPWCSHCQHLAPTWEELAKVLDTSAAKIAKIDCTVYRTICQDFEVRGYPTLLWIEDGKKIEKYAGSRELKDLKAYVEKMSGKDITQEIRDSKDEAEDVVDSKKKVLQLSSDNFKKMIENDVTFVKFFAPWCGHCKKLSPIWDELAEKVHTTRKDIKIAKIDCTVEENRNICSLEQILGYPTLLIYRNGQKLEEYEGLRSLPELEHFVKTFSGHDEL